MLKREYTFIETFAGAGGSHQGFKNAGFKTNYATDAEENMIKTSKYNNKDIPEKNLVVEDIKNVSAKKILRIGKLKKGELDVLFGGIVCKGFSLAGVRDPTDPRNKFYKEQLRLVEGLAPKISIIENVPAMQSMIIADKGLHEEKSEKISEIFQKLKNYNGIKSIRTKKGEKLSKEEIKHINELKDERNKLISTLKNNSIKIFDDIKRIYNNLSYDIKIKKLNAADYGAATKRERIFIVAVRRDLNINFEWPKKTHLKKEQIDLSNFIRGNKKSEQYVTVNNALSKLDICGINAPEIDEDNKPMNHNGKSIRRFKLIPEGKNIVTVLNQLPSDLKISKFYSRGCTMRLAGDKPAPTLVPGHSNFPVHPREHRSITVREAAIITGFPINYKFFGSHTSRCSQVGNAVPIKLAEAIAKQAKKALINYYKN